jgi:hypothetical protein
MGSSIDAVREYVDHATTNVLVMSSAAYGNVGQLTFSGVEDLDVTSTAVADSADLLFVRGTGKYDAKGGDDTLYADLSAMTTAVLFDADSDQTYSYLGNEFTNFERYLISAGSGDDVIDTASFSYDDWLNLGSGTHQVYSGGGSDYVSMSGDGNNQVHAGTGNDTVLSGSGIDVIEVGTGNDSVVAGAGNDVISVVVDGTDSVSAGADWDYLLVDASAFSHFSLSMVWSGTDAQGANLGTVGMGSSIDAVREYVDHATTNVLVMSSANYGNVGRRLLRAGRDVPHERRLHRGCVLRGRQLHRLDDLHGRRGLHRWILVRLPLDVRSARPDRLPHDGRLQLEPALHRERVRRHRHHLPARPRVPRRPGLHEQRVHGRVRRRLGLCDGRRLHRLVLPPAPGLLLERRLHER